MSMTDGLEVLIGVAAPGNSLTGLDPREFRVATGSQEQEWCREWRWFWEAVGGGMGRRPLEGGEGGAIVRYTAE